eukprot:1316169-Amorphochlora_amoeboformis.AAC.1
MSHYVAGTLYYVTVYIRDVTLNHTSGQHPFPNNAEVFTLLSSFSPPQPDAFRKCGGCRRSAGRGGG